jgi:hypothetical protein
MKIKELKVENNGFNRILHDGAIGLIAILGYFAICGIILG